MKLSASLLILIAVLLLSSCNYLKKHRLFSRDVDTVLDMTLVEPEPIEVDSSAFVMEEPIVEPVIEEPPVQQPMPAVGYGSDKYYMIVGSFQNPNLAERYAEKMQQMGYMSQVIEANNGFYRVSAKSYSDFRTGVGEIETFRATVASRAWLHVKQ
jgi:cell division protein FtsN